MPKISKTAIKIEHFPKNFNFKIKVLLRRTDLEKIS